MLFSIEGEKLTFTRDDTSVGKAVAIILMLVHHLFGFKSRLGEGMEYIPMFSGDVEYAVGGFGKICVAIFIFLSGYGTYKAFSGKKDLFKKAGKKVFGLYKKYWSVFFIFIPIGMLIGVERIKINLADFLLNLTAIDTSYCGEWWFITPFIIITLVSPVIVRFVDRKWASNIVIDLLLALVASTFLVRGILHIFDYAVFEPVLSNPLGKAVEEAVEFFPAFFMGCVVAKYNLYDKYLQLFKKPYVAIPVAVVIMVAVYYLRRQFTAEYDYIFAPLFVIASTSFAKSIPPLYKVLKEIGSVSTEIWLIHTFYCYHFIPQIIYAPKNAILITLWLLVISYASGKLIVLATNQFEKLTAKIKSEKVKEPSV